MNEPNSVPQSDLDPVFVHGRREAGVILAIWAVSMIWTVSYCYLFGYRAPDPETLELVLGMPSWVFWGVAVPWIAALGATFWFAQGYMVLDDLGENDDAPSGTSDE